MFASIFVLFMSTYRHFIVLKCKGKYDILLSLRYEIMMKIYLL